MQKIEIAIERISPTLAVLRIGSAAWHLKIFPDTCPAPEDRADPGDVE